MGADTPFTYWFTVAEVYDGDTIMGELDMGLAHYLGHQNRPYYSIRLYGINAPEMNDPNAAIRAAAVESRDHLAALLPIGDYVKVVAMGWDKYRMRIDAVPYTDQGVDCCQAQIDGGFAVPYTV